MQQSTHRNTRYCCAFTPQTYLPQIKILRFIIVMGSGCEAVPPVAAMSECGYFVRNTTTSRILQREYIPVNIMLENQHLGNR